MSDCVCGHSEEEHGASGECQHGWELKEGKSSDMREGPSQGCSCAAFETDE